MTMNSALKRNGYKGINYYTNQGTGKISKVGQIEKSALSEIDINTMKKEILGMLNDKSLIQKTYLS